MRGALLGLVCLATAGGCIEDVDGVLDVPVPFTLYGYVDPTVSRQVIRVVPLTRTIDDSVAVDAAVSTTDLVTGEVTVWQDSLVTFPDRTQGTVYAADFTPAPGTRLRLEVESRDGEVASAEVTVPPVIAPEIRPAERSFGEVTYPIRYVGAPQVLGQTVRILVAGIPNLPGVVVLRARLQDRPVEVEPGTWEVRVPFLLLAREALRTQGISNGEATLVAVEYAGFVADAGWDPRSLDPGSAGEPGAFTNVEGGFGFIGAGHESVARWVPSPAVQAAAGFAINEEAAALLTLNEVSTAEGWVEIYNPLFTSVDLDGYGLSDDASEPRKQVFQLGDAVPGRGFLAVPLAFPIEDGQTIGLFSRTGDQLRRLFASRTGDGLTHGSYPDGLSLRIDRTDDDLYQGPLAPTPGGPNEPAFRPAVVNEVFAGGDDGFVEAAIRPGATVQHLVAFSAPDLFFNAVTLSDEPFAVAPETARFLELPQVTGTVYLAALFDDPILDRRVTRVVDARTYRGQVPGRSAGYLPDGPDGDWTPELRPTRAAPNATARRSL